MGWVFKGRLVFPTCRSHSLLSTEIAFKVLQLINALMEVWLPGVSDWFMYIDITSFAHLLLILRWRVFCFVTSLCCVLTMQTPP